jgi:hypothetical protein
MNALTAYLDMLNKIVKVIELEILLINNKGKSTTSKLT